MEDVRKDVAELLGQTTPSKPVENKAETSSKLKVGAEIKLVPGATYASGKTIPAWLFDSKLYLREIRPNGEYIFSTRPSGAITGVVKPESVVAYKSNEPAFKPYLAKITANLLNVRAGAGTEFAVKTQVKKNGVYTIIEEKNGWGKLKSGAGWISLKYTEKL